MYYTVDSDKSFEQASADLDAAVKRHGFGVLHVGGALIHLLLVIAVIVVIYRLVTGRPVV